MLQIHRKNLPLDRMVSHLGKSQRVKYVVRLYGYTAVYETLEPPGHILEQFITRNWRRALKQDASRQRQRKRNRGGQGTHDPYSKGQHVSESIPTNRQYLPKYMAKLSMNREKSKYTPLVSVNYQPVDFHTENILPTNADVRNGAKLGYSGVNNSPSFAINI